MSVCGRVGECVEFGRPSFSTNAFFRDTRSKKTTKEMRSAACCRSKKKKWGEQAAGI